MRKTRKVAAALCAITLLALIWSVGNAAQPFGNAAQLFGNAAQFSRDLLVSFVARRNAGEETFLNEELAGYTHDVLISRWGIVSNSEWLLNWTRLIVPYMYYEGLSYKAIYPSAIVFLPMQDQASFHLGGQASCAKRVIALNERFVYGHWPEEDALLTLVHELVHIQGGAFCNGNSEDVEAYTSAVTVELLAGMCNHGVALACRSFWGEIAGMARNGLPMGVRDMLRSEAERIRADKSWRYWNSTSERKQALEEILSKYVQRPWKLVLGAATNRNMAINSGNYRVFFMYSGGRLDITPLMVVFDDTRALWLRGGLWWLVWLY